MRYVTQNDSNNCHLYSKKQEIEIFQKVNRTCFPWEGNTLEGWEFEANKVISFKSEGTSEISVIKIAFSDRYNYIIK